MTGRHPIPLAWKNLTHNRVRAALFAAGIGFAVVLMFIQLGCRNALLDSCALLIERLRADLVLVPRQQTSLIARSPFPRQLLVRALAAPGVAGAYPLYIEYSRSFLQDTHPDEADRAPARTVRVIGLDPDAFLIDLPPLDPASPHSRVASLRLPGRALFDRKGKRGGRPGESVYGPVAVGTRTGLAGTQVQFVGLVDLGADFGTDGTVVVSEETFRLCVRRDPAGGPTPGLDQIDLGLLRLAPGADPAAARAALRSLLADDGIDVLTRDEFVAREKRFWADNTPVGYVFGFGVGIGFLVGLVICYQILSGDVRDNLPAYATLRAIGYPNRFLRKVVIEEALLLAGLGFVPGLAVSALAYAVLAHVTDLPMRLTVGRVGFILLLTTVMCACSGLLAARQAQRVDPAEVF